ncbi:MAG: glycerophosphoryl diester phosphodiesterase [Acidimicrobiaceae bacterium]|nr:glycerophosphoryl diester phosphodiesterase [Acidimicrobiaceae bacterium]
MSLIFAHRGVHRKARENTLAAFEDALSLGVDGVELDVRRSADGALVVHHDPVAEGHVIARSFARDLPSYVPRLGDAMAALRAVSVNVEIKNLQDSREPTYDQTGAFAHDVLEALADLRRSQRLTLSCFDLATCELIRSFDNEIYIGWLIRRTSLPKALKSAKERGFNAVNPHFRLVSRSTAHEASELNVELNVWTVNRSRDVRAMDALEVTSIITDQPARALRLRDEST